MSNSNGKTCVTCAKAKIKCDKMMPRCGRCVRLNIDCCAQLRGRGRPPSILETAREEESPSTSSTVVLKAKVKKLMMVESLKSSLQNAVEEGLKGSNLDKCVAVIKWLLDVACCSKSEYTYDSVMTIGEMVGGNCVLNESGYRSRIIQTSRRRGCMNTPSYISSMNCDGSAFLIQHSINGSCIFSANEDMTERFISTKEANAIYINGGGDPDSVARSLIASRDRPLYMKALCAVLVEHQSLNAETSLICHCIKRGYDDDPSENVLCLCNIRLSLSPDGREMVLGIKFSPVPMLSEYIVVKEIAQSSKSPTSSPLLPNHDDEVPTSFTSSHAMPTDNSNAIETGASYVMPRVTSPVMLHDLEGCNSPMHDFQIEQGVDVGFTGEFDFSENDLMAGWEEDTSLSQSECPDNRNTRGGASSSMADDMIPPQSEVSKSSRRKDKKVNEQQQHSQSGSSSSAADAIYGEILDLSQYGDFTFGVDESAIAKMYSEGPVKRLPSPSTAAVHAQPVKRTLSPMNKFSSFPVQRRKVEKNTASKDKSRITTFDSKPQSFVAALPCLPTRNSSFSTNSTCSLASVSPSSTPPPHQNIPSRPILCVEIKSNNGGQYDKGDVGSLLSEKTHMDSCGFLNPSVNPFELQDPKFTHENLTEFLSMTR